MKISNEFTVHTPIDKAWAVLTDLEGIAPCLPGAQLTGVAFDKVGGGESDALKATDLAGDRLCG